ncbi:MAG: FAD-dependent oxidoreductase [Lautropia sp.]
MPRPRHCEIAGAGIAGLSAACVLASRGWSVRMHERTPELRELGAGIFLKANSLQVLRDVGALPLVERTGLYMNESQIRDERNRVLVRREIPGGSLLMTHREDLLQALAQRARELGVRIETGSAAVGASSEGLLLMADGRQLEADLVVGADGHRSAVRDSVGLLAEHRLLDDGTTRLLIPKLRYEVEPMTFEYWSKDCRVGVAACSRDQTYIYLTAPERNRPATAVPVDTAFWTSRFPMLGHVFDRITPDLGRHDQHAYVRARAWSSGSVAIIGDSAIAQPPNLGQGAGLAIAMSWALGGYLDRSPDIRTALREWEVRCRAAAEEIQLWSLRYGRIGCDWPKALLGLRSGLIWSLGHFGITKRQWSRLAMGNPAHFVVNGRSQAKETA